jgi:type IV pilus assembly protein PilO
MAISKQDLIKMPKWQKALILVGFILILGVVWYFVFYSPNDEEVVALQGQINKLNKDIVEWRKAKEAKVTLAAQIKQLEQELQLLQSKLPEEKEIPSLLSSVNEIGRLNGLEFALFKQQNVIRRDYYSEIPVEINVQGGFHQVLLFLDKVGSMDRIVQVSKLKMGKYKPSAGGGNLEATMVATTYKYESQPLPKKEEKKGGKGAAAPPHAGKPGKGPAD